jgi:prepilin-type N-terminal cleavage/methylation domain-containing protein
MSSSIAWRTVMGRGGGAGAALPEPAAGVSAAGASARATDPAHIRPKTVTASSVRDMEALRRTVAADGLLRPQPNRYPTPPGTPHRLWAMLMTMRRNAQSGMTLIELAVAVAILGVLIKLVLPAFTSQAHKAEGDSEVAAFFAELSAKEEQYKIDHAVYLSTGTSETTTWPTTPKAQLQNVTPLPATWTSLRVVTPASTVRCGYVAIAGTATTGTVGSIATTNFGFVKPSRSWYYLLAHCNLDGNSTKDSYYFASSLDARIQKLNWGS